MVDITERAAPPIGGTFADLGRATQPQDGGPAFPFAATDQSNVTMQAQGMSQRALAAIKLRVPDSGIDWLDAMIMQAKRNEFAGQALAGILGGGFADTIPYDDVDGSAAAAVFAYQFADAMIAERNKP